MKKKCLLISRFLSLFINISAFINLRKDGEQMCLQRLFTTATARNRGNISKAKKFRGIEIEAKSDVKKTIPRPPPWIKFQHPKRFKFFFFFFLIRPSYIDMRALNATTQKQLNHLLVYLVLVGRFRVDSLVDRWHTEGLDWPHCRVTCDSHLLEKRTAA